MRARSGSRALTSHPDELLLELLRVLAVARGAVELGAAVEGLLPRGDELGVALPGLERLVLQRAAVGEAELPGVRAHLVHRIQVRGRLRARLAAGEDRKST